MAWWRGVSVRATMRTLEWLAVGYLLAASVIAVLAVLLVFWPVLLWERLARVGVWRHGGP